MRFDKNIIELEHGDITLDLVYGDSYNPPKIEFDVQYSRSELGYFKFKTFDNLEDAYNQYLKWHENAKGM